jgi:hypothetical protein
VVLDAPVVTVVAVVVGLGVVVDVALADVEGLLDADLLALAEGLTVGLRLGLAEWLVGSDGCAGLLELVLCPELAPVDPLDAPVPWELPELPDPVAPEVARPEAVAEEETDAEVLAADEELAPGTPAGSVEPGLCGAVVFTF